MIQEEWRPIKNHEGYEVSNLGRVRSLPRLVNTHTKKRGDYQRLLKGRVLSVQSKCGYYRVKLGAGAFYFVHRIVAEAFIPNPENLPFINHKDENKKNNIPSNLEWCTKRYNNLYNGRQQRCAASRKKNDPENLWAKRGSEKRRRTESFDKFAEYSKIRFSKKVRQLGLNGDEICVWNSVSEAASSIHGQTTHISAVCKGKRRSYHGFKWEYV